MSATPDPTERLGERARVRPGNSETTGNASEDPNATMDTERRGERARVRPGNSETTGNASEDPNATMDTAHRVDQPGVDATADAVDGTDLPDGAPELPWEPATAYSIEGYDQDDPWNAVLCVEGQTTEIVLELTPTHLDRLVAGLSDVRDAQRYALGVGPDDTAEPDQAAHEPAGGIGRVTSAARLATGSAPVARLWNSGTNGRLIIIGGVVLFVVLGVILSVVLQ